MAEETPELVNDGLLDGLPAEIPDVEPETPAEEVEETPAEETPAEEEAKPDETPAEAAEEKPAEEAAKPEKPAEPAPEPQLAGFDAKAANEAVTAYNSLIEARKALDARVDDIKADKDMDVLERGAELSLLAIDRQRTNEQLAEAGQTIETHRTAYQRAAQQQVQAQQAQAWTKFSTDHKDLAETPAAVIDEGKKLWQQACDDVQKRYPGKSRDYLFAKAESIFEDKVQAAAAQRRSAKATPKGPAKAAAPPAKKVLPAASARTRPPTKDDPEAELAKIPGIGSFLS